MKKIITLTLIAICISASVFALGPIYGTLGCCVGDSGYLTADSSVSGTWSSSSPAVATVTATGEVSGITAGTATISYSYGGSYVTAVFTVSPAPGTFTGTTTFCETATSSLSNSVPGGTWSSSDVTIVTVGSTTGLASGMSSGWAIIYYSTGTGCSSPIGVTITTEPVDTILGSTTLCPGTTGTLTDATPGGTWSSGVPSIATISSAGVVTGISSGITTISYTVTGSCGTGVSIVEISVGGSPSASGISGYPGIYVSYSASLVCYPIGGTGAWSSSVPTIATVDATGLVTGVSPGTATISYTVSSCGATDVATVICTVSPLDRISGQVLFSGTAPTGGVKVWLIHYNPGSHMLEAYDSLITSASVGFHYEFNGVPTDSFRVKAAIDSAYLTTGYVPTYHTASFYWSSANVIYHTSGTTDDGEDINMAYGAVTPGPGFISGDVTTGANKGTSGAAPAVGLLIYVVNQATGTLIQQTYTDAAGHYSFSGLLVGQTYKVYPELINYATTAYTSISLTSSASSMTAARFVQHTISHTITPIPEGIGNVSAASAAISVFPNPSNNMIALTANMTKAETGTVTITDVMGREWYRATTNMAAGTNSSTIAVSGFAPGLYLVSYNSQSMHFVTNISVQH